MKHRFCICLIVVAIITLSNSSLTAQTRNYRSTNYTPKQYGIIYEARNLAIAQDKQGIMYFGTANGILKHNGATWKHIMLKTGVWVQSIFIDSSNTMYAGAQNEFGLFQTNKQGEQIYISLSDSIADLVFPFSDIWRIFEIDGKIIFQAYEYLFIYDGTKTHVVEPSTSFHNSFQLNNEFYVRQRDIGLMKLNGEVLEIVPNGDIFAKIGVFGMVQLQNNKVLIATYEDGTYIMDSNGINKNNSQLNNSIEQLNFKITSCTQLDSNTIAFGSFDNGFAVFKTNGEIVAHKNIYNNLIDNTINCIYIDHEGNLWVTTNKGICNFSNNKNLSLYTIDDGIEGGINTIIRFQNRLFLGTSNGLLVQNAGKNSFTQQQFQPIKGMMQQIWSLSICDNSLMIGTNNGLYELRPDMSIHKISNIEAYCMIYNNQKKTLFTGGRYGLTTYNYNNGWKQSSWIHNTFNVNAIAIDSTNSKGLTIWLGSNYQGIMQVVYQPNGKNYTTHYTHEVDGISTGRIVPIELDNKILFNNNGHLFNFISEDEMVLNLPDSLKNDERYYRGAFQDAMQNPIESIYYITQSNTKTWITTGINVGFINNSDSLFIDIPFRGIEVGKINTIYPEESGITWIGATDGLVKFDENVTCKYNTPFNCIINDLKISGTSYLQQHKTTEIDYKDNSITFEYVAPWFRYPNKIQYSYILEGLMDSWSEWSDKRETYFPNLREGSYSFKVKARNAFGIESSELIYSIMVDDVYHDFESSTDLFVFSIKPPWYRSIWAITLYVVAVFALIWGIIKYYTFQLKVRNRYLEQVVAERTHEVVKQKEQIELQNKDLANQNELILIQKAEITDSIKYAEHIQRSMLSDIDIIKDTISEAFILFRPRDIVSGDFYWCSKLKDKLIVVAADCTGHGVPGAFMSMLGISFLNLIVNEKHVTDTSKIVTMLRENIIKSFGSNKEETKDGMDICVICFDKTASTVQYTGAINSLIHVRGENLTEYKADKMPVGFYEFAHSDFTSTIIDVEKGDCLYLFSDGYCDQFSELGRKFMKANFKKLLTKINQSSMEQQKKQLTQCLETHMGNSPQIDDILVIGLKI